MFIVNHSVKGLENVDLESKELENTSEKVIIVLDKSKNYDYSKVYSRVKRLLAKCVEIYVVFVGKPCNEYKAISNLMAIYENYNMYYVDSAELVFKPYVDSIVSRNPNYEEVANLLDGEIVAVSDVSGMILIMENLVKEGNIEALENYIKDNMNVIRKFSSAIDYMKMVMDKANTKEIEKALEVIKQDLEKADKKVVEYNTKYTKIAEDKERIEKSLNEKAKELEKTLSSMESLRSQLSSGNSGPRITSYGSTNTKLLNCKVKVILYFKEISYVRYTNSFVMNFVKYLEALKSNNKSLRVKLMIYDDGVNFPAMYSPLNVISGEEYSSRSQLLMGKVDKLVICEPAPNIITDILEYNVDPYDIVVVYDRMKQSNDVVNGNNVHKIFVVNSKKDLENTKGILGIQENSPMIVPENSDMEGFKIQTVPEYNNQTETAKQSKYIKLTGKEGNTFKKIVQLSRIDSLTR